MGDSPDCYKLCRSCPLRHQADLLEYLGATEQARVIREGGCGWWQEGIPSVDPQLGFMAQPTFTGCFKPLLPSYLVTVWHSSGHSTAAFNDARNKLLDAISEDGNGDDVLRSLASVGILTIAGGERERRKALARLLAGQESVKTLPPPNDD